MDASPSTSGRTRSRSLHWVNLVVVPLASWLLILAYLFLASRSLKRNNFNLNHYITRIRQAPHRFWFPHHVTAIVTVLAIGMSILEVVRLCISHQGPGALFFTPIGFGIALLLHYGSVRYPKYESGIYSAQPNGKVTRSAGKWKPGLYQRNTLLAFWLLELVFQCVKIGVLANQTVEDPRYKKSDEVLDLAVLAGLIAILVVLEFFPGQGVLTISQEEVPKDANLLGPTRTESATEPHLS